MPRLDPELEYLLERKSHFEKNPEEARKHPDAIPDNQQILNISIHLKDSIDPIKQAGFTLTSSIGMVAFGTITLENLQKLIDLPNVLAIEKMRKTTLQLDKSVPDIRADQVWSRSGDSFSNITGRDAIVGIIDTGINFRHDSFRRANGTTRILRIWDQTLTVQGSEKFPDPITDLAIVNPSNSPTPPSTTMPLAFGVEYTEQQINGTLQNANLPVKCRHSDDDGHGTHVAGIAAGNGRQSGGTANGGCQGNYNYIGVAPEADIIMVRLWHLSKNDSNTPPTGAGNVVLQAICYILNHAKLTFKKPVVINLSLGFYGENMDGSRTDCMTMNDLLNNTANDEGFAIVFAAGNEADSNFHAKDTVPAGPTASLRVRFRIKKNDKKIRQIQIVYSGNNLQVRVTSPLGAAAGGQVGWVTGGNSGSSNTANGTTSGASVSISNKVPGPNPNRITITIDPGTVAPNTPGNNLASTATNDWLLELQDTGSTATAIDAWFIGGSKHDQQSPFFLDSTTVQTTLSEQATATEVITVGSYNVETGLLAPSSGRGLTSGSSPIMKPEITAPGVGIESANIPTKIPNANCCCACCHDFYITMSGTSMAAPHVAGAIALMLHKNPNLKHGDIIAQLNTHARPKPAGSTVDEDMGWGAGKLDIKATIDDPVIGGGGVISGPHSPYYKPEYETEENYNEQEELVERFWRSKRAPEFVGLFKKYFYEIRDLINHNRRVATVWHRSKGPLWIRAGIRAMYTPQLPLQLTIDGFSLQEGIARMMGILKRYGSSMLIQDLAKYEQELQLVHEGMNVYDLMDLISEPEIGVEIK